MARRSSKVDGALILIAIAMIAPVAAYKKITEAGAWPVVISVVAAAIISYATIKALSRRARQSALFRKYGDMAIVKKIMHRVIWDGMSAEQLIDALGQPAARDNKYLKSKTREIWKYYHQGANRFGLRVTVDDGVVRGWDSKR